MLFRSSIGMLLQTVIQGIPLDPLGMPQQTIGEMGLRMFNDAKAAISMGKMDGLLRRVRRLELRVKYCQHLHKTRKLSITHRKGEENPSDGLTKSLRGLSLWTNLVEAVGFVPGPTDQGSSWIRNFLNMIQQENDLDTFLALPFVDDIGANLNKLAQSFVKLSDVIDQGWPHPIQRWRS